MKSIDYNSDLLEKKSMGLKFYFKIKDARIKTRTQSIRRVKNLTLKSWEAKLKPTDYNSDLSKKRRMRYNFTVKDGGIKIRTQSIRKLKNLTLKSHEAKYIMKSTSYNFDLLKRDARVQNFTSP